MAIPILPMATAGGCSGPNGCCPKWFIDCCPYKRCGISSRLHLSSSRGEAFLLGSNGVWGGVFWGNREGFNNTIRYEATLACQDGQWQMGIIGRTGAGAGQSDTATEFAINATCDPLRLEFLFSDWTDFNTEQEDLAITVTEARLNKCQVCCSQNEYQLIGPISFGEGYVCPPTLEDARLLFEQKQGELPLCLWSGYSIFGDGFPVNEINFQLGFEPDEGGNLIAVVHVWFKNNFEGGAIPFELAVYKSAPLTCNESGSTLCLDLFSSTDCQPPESICFQVA